MNISYLQNNRGNNATWKNISRDDRYFYYELFQNLKANQKEFLTLIKKGNLSNDDPNRLDIPDNMETHIFDIGFEVYFYNYADQLSIYEEEK